MAALKASRMENKDVTIYIIWDLTIKSYKKSLMVTLITSKGSSEESRFKSTCNFLNFVEKLIHKLYKSHI